MKPKPLLTITLMLTITTLLILPADSPAFSLTCCGGSESRLPFGASTHPTARTHSPARLTMMAAFDNAGDDAVYKAFLPTVSSKAAQLIFVSHGNLGFWNEIFFMDSDGSNVTRLTDDPARDRRPNYSTDGKKIVFHSDRDGDMELYIMDHDGSNLLQVTDNARYDCCASWSPDDSKLVFTGDGPGGPWEIYTINVDGTGEKNLTNDPGWDAHPAWSPVANQIAFESTRSGQSEIYLMRTDGSGLHNLTNHPGHDFNPAWSPDGGAIAFASIRENSGAWDIYSMMADGSEQTNLTNAADDIDSYSYYHFPAWSADGKQITYTSNFDDTHVGFIYVMESDGSNQTLISSNGVESSWRP